MDVAMRVRLKDQQVQRWQRLAVQANIPAQLYTRPLAGKDGMATLLDEAGQLMGRNLAWQDGAFWLEARQAVIDLAEEVQERREYQAYADDCLKRVKALLTGGLAMKWVPLTFEEWRAAQAAPVGRAGK